MPAHVPGPALPTSMDEEEQALTAAEGDREEDEEPSRRLDIMMLLSTDHVRDLKQWFLSNTRQGGAGGCRPVPPLHSWLSVTAAHVAWQEERVCRWRSSRWRCAHA